MKITFNNATIELTPTGKSYRAALGDKRIDVEILHADDGRLELLIDGKRLIAYVSSENAKRWVTVNGRTYLLVKQSGARPRAEGHRPTAGDLTAPMPGQVRAVNVSEGETVARGQTLLILEAMKMEIRIQSPLDGIVKKVLVKQGETVEREQVLVKIVERLES